MRFLSIARWQGALLGCHVGERLQRQNPQGRNITPYLQIGQQLLESSIENRYLSRQACINLYRRYSDELDRACSGDLILAVLPLILLYHDSRRELEQKLDFLGDSWQQPTQSLEDVLIWSYLIDLALREQLKPQHWLDDVIRLAQTRQTPLGDLLQLVKILLHDAIPMHQGIKQLTRGGTPQQLAIALSLYCFGSTPDDFRLGILRASQLEGSSSKLTIALVGLLSGIYNSISGFPLAWRLAYQNSPTTQPLYQQAVQLFAMWSGAIDATHSLLKTPLASFGVIQQRTSSNIISQNRFEI